MSAAPIQFVGNEARIDFSDFTLENYELFLRVKCLPEYRTKYDQALDVYTLSMPARFAALLGAKVPEAPTAPLPLSGFLFDYQRFIDERALEAKRYAVFADCGLGKTPIQLEFARQVMHLTGGKFLILTFGEIIDEFLDQGRQFYGDALPIKVLKSRDSLIGWLKRSNEPPLAITNYEKFIPGVIPELRYLAGLAADESSVLKTKGGVIKWNLMKSAYGIEYKILASATPAPNDEMEYLSQAGFLDKFNDGSGSGSTLASFFSRNGDNDWVLKPHAKEAFYRYMVSWSCYIRDPRVYGFRDNLRPVPQPEFIEHMIDATKEQIAVAQDYRFRIGAGLLGSGKLGATERMKLSEIAKGFLYDPLRFIPSRKPRRVAEIACEEAAQGNQTLIWTVFDEEGQLISEEIKRLISSKRKYRHLTQAILTGKTPEHLRRELIWTFKRGQLSILTSKAKLLGFGQNLQNGGAMIFSGWTDSFEQLYQAIRRMVRYGQTKVVRVHVPMIPELEALQWENIQAKSAAYEEQAALQERLYREAMLSNA